jgi:ATP-dependent HslUV protease ATP-binding subunit HslU
MEAEGLALEFTEEALQELAAVAAEVNRTVDNIGARRLHTVLEKIVDELSFSAPDRVKQWKIDHGDDGSMCKCVGAAPPALRAALLSLCFTIGPPLRSSLGA